MVVLYMALALLALFLAVILLRALAFKPRMEPAAPADALDVDAERLTQNLQAMLRFKTVSYAEEGRADPAQFAAFRALLETLYPQVFARYSVELHGRNGLLLRLSGHSAQAPSVLMAHYDVVPAEEGQWAHPPFEGQFSEGELWGRGALDTKCTVLGVLEAAEALLERGFTPRNDVYLAFGGDEETLGLDAAAIVDALKARGVRPAFVLDEGGAVVQGVFPGVSRSAALVGIAEKGSAFVDLAFTGRGGHASAPPAVQAVGGLARALVRLQKRPLPFTLTPPAKALFDTLGRHSGFAYRLVFANLWCFSPLLDLICRKAGGELNALVRTTAALTRLSGSEAYNVLPVEAKAGVNLRLIPGDSLKKACASLENALSGTGVSVSLVRGSEPSAVSPAVGEPWNRLATAIRQTFPDAIVSPYLMLAASDSRHYGQVSKHVYRFSPLPLTKAQLGLIHSPDERIPVALLPELKRFYMRVLMQC